MSGESVGMSGGEDGGERMEGVSVGSEELSEGEG